MKKKSLLDVRNLSFSIDSAKIINDFTLGVSAGEIVAILGESGSGKTTLLRLIAGLEQPAAGTLYLENERIVPPAEKLIAGHPEIKLVRQDYGLFPNISLRENIAYELRFYENDYREERIDKLLKVSGLSGIANRLPREVSGGEQQRAVIARALADEPRLLLLDEPFSHLDRPNKERLKSEIVALIKNENSGCIFVTHEVSDAYGIADEIVVLRAGMTLQSGPPETVYRHPVDAYTAEITGACTILAASEFHNVFAETIPAEKRAVIRPEAIKISEQGFPAVIKNRIFNGQGYTYDMVREGVHFQWVTDEIYPPETEVNLQLKAFSLIGR